MGSLWLAWPCGLAALAWLTFRAPWRDGVSPPTWRALAREAARSWPVRALSTAWLVGAVTLAAAYPSPLVRGAGLARLYLGAELAALVVAMASFVTWAAERRRATLAHATVLLLLAFEAANLLAGAFRRDMFARWYLAQAQLVALYALLFLLEVSVWTTWSRSKRS